MVETFGAQGPRDIAVFGAKNKTWGGSRHPVVESGDGQKNRFSLLRHRRQIHGKKAVARYSAVATKPMSRIPPPALIM